MKHSIAVVSLATLFVTGGAYAAGTTAPAAAMPAKATTTAKAAATKYHEEFVKLDANKDGYLTKKEVHSNAKLSKDFRKYSKHGRMSEKEFAAWQHKHETVKKS